MNKPITAKKAALLSELHAALTRLAEGKPRKIKPPYQICMNTVCKEADRDRSSIKTSDEFAELRSLISVQAALKNQRDSASRVSRTEHEKLKTQIDCLRERLSKADEALNDAVETIYDLNVALVNVEEDYRQLMQLLTTIRSTNPTVDKALRLGGLESQSS